MKKIPVILDTDIGIDFDDTFALAMMLKSPELDVRLVITDVGDTEYRARIVARMLEIAGRTDIPVAVGINQNPDKREPQARWVEDYKLSQYPGVVYEDGVNGLIKTIMDSKEEITLICIGPVPNIAEALRREPRIAEKTRFVGMHGSFHWSYMESGEAIAEHNVEADIRSCQKVFTAAWHNPTITPLDSCGKIRLSEDKYKEIENCTDPLVQAVIENWRIWSEVACGYKKNTVFFNTILFDTVAVYLAFADDLLVMKQMGVRVTDDGFTMQDNNANSFRVAMDWKDLAGFEDLLVNRLTTKANNPGVK